MSPALTVLLIAILIVGLSIAGIAIKMFVKKDGEFKKSCGTTDPTTGDSIGCSCGGGSCENPA
jgi:hypothetical protein